MKELAERICDLLENGRPAAVATILSRSGSAPRTAGSKMVVEEDGSFVGTIGGGKFEADVLAEAKWALAEARPKKMFFDLTGDDVSAMDMICGGQMEVLVDYLAPETETAEVFSAWKAAMEGKKAGSLVTGMRENDSGLEQTSHCMVYADQTVTGSWPLSGELLYRAAKTPSVSAVSRLIEVDEMRLLVEPTIVPKTLLIFGAGHVSMPTARLAGEVGFQVVVVDDRKAFANRDRFPGADRILVPEDFGAALSGLSVDADTFAAIVTRGHRYDREVLAQVLSTGAGYIGMIGSRKKRDAIYAALKKEGFSEEDLSRVHCPIGLSIGAETPAEIAVSIVAELIACRAGME